MKCIRLSNILPICAAALFSVGTAQANDTAAFKSRFDGSYVGLTGGYDFSLSSTDQRGSFPVVPLDSLQGGKVGVIGGYNATSNALLMGFEARAQYSFSRSSASTSFYQPGTSLPSRQMWMQCYGCSQDFLDNYPISNNPIILNYSQTNSIVRTRPWQGDLSLRAGVIFQDWLIFAKFGAGAEETVTKTTRDSSGTSVCDPTVVRQRPAINEVQLVAVGCKSVTPGPITETQDRYWSPIAILGFGVERNFGSVFVRAESEMVTHFGTQQNGDSIYYTPAVNVSVGYRF